MLFDVLKSKEKSTKIDIYLWINNICVDAV